VGFISVRTQASVYWTRLTLKDYLFINNGLWILSDLGQQKNVKTTRIKVEFEVLSSAKKRNQECNVQKFSYSHSRVFN
jgi:hypothetical protein